MLAPTAVMLSLLEDVEIQFSLLVPSPPSKILFSVLQVRQQFNVFLVFVLIVNLHLLRTSVEHEHGLMVSS